MSWLDNVGDGMSAVGEAVGDAVKSEVASLVLRSECPDDGTADSLRVMGKPAPSPAG